MGLNPKYYSENYPFDQKFCDIGSWAEHERVMKGMAETRERIKNDPVFREEVMERFELHDLFSRMTQADWDAACERYGRPKINFNNQKV